MGTTWIFLPAPAPAAAASAAERRCSVPSALERGKREHVRTIAHLADCPLPQPSQVTAHPSCEQPGCHNNHYDMRLIGAIFKHLCYSMLEHWRT